MAKKRKAQLPRQSGRSPASQRPGDQIQEALRHLRRGDVPTTLRLSAQALKAAQARSDLPAAAQVETSRQVLAEAYFRAAAGAPDAEARLEHLDSALQYAPALAKLHFHRALALWQLGRLREAIPELDVAFAKEPGRPWLAYLRQLARLAAGQAWDDAGLAPAEANTLRLVKELLAGRASHPSAALPDELLGKGVEMWEALVQMRQDPQATPVAALLAAAEQNGRKPVSRILSYYLGVAAIRGGDRVSAAAAWRRAREAGLQTSWSSQNLGALLQEDMFAAAAEGRWQDVVNAFKREPALAQDRILAETAALAYYHLGYEAGLAGRWSTAVQHWRAANELHGSRHLAQNLALAEEALGNWEQAAEAWRDMVRRRPRKPDHPDYLSDAQVAAIWNHAAECYQRAGAGEQAVATLKSAVKYAPENVDQRLKLVDALIKEERDEAAANELERIVEVAPQHEEALMRLGNLYKLGRGVRWDADPMAIWRRVLAVNPGNTEAREELAEAYLAQINPEDLPFGSFPPLRFWSEQTPLQLLQEALQELPGHPKLLLEMGTQYRLAGKKKDALAYLLQAYEAGPRDVQIVANVMHELLHAGAGDEVTKRLPQVRQIPNLLPAFWIDQGARVLECKLDQDWAVRFFDEAFSLVGQPWVDDTPAGVLSQVAEAAYEHEAEALGDTYVQRIRQEAPDSGASEYIEAFRLFMRRHDIKGALKLLRKAIQLARAAKDAGVLRRAQTVEEDLRSAPPSLSGLLETLRDME